MAFAQQPRLGLVQFASFPGQNDTPEQVLSTLAPLLENPGLRAVELRAVPEPSHRRQLAAALAERGLQVMFSAGPQLLTGGFALCATDPATRQAALNVVRPLVRQASELGARNILVVSGPNPGPEQQSAAGEALAESLVDLSRHAEGCRPHDPVVITLEHFDRTLQWRQFAGPSALTAELLGAARARGARVGVTLDLAHVAQLDEDLHAATQVLAPFVVHAHAANAILSPGAPGLPRFGAPGSVFTPDQIVQFLQELQAIGYFDRANPCGGPVVSVEVRPGSSEDPAAVSLEAFGHLTAAWRAFAPEVAPHD